MTLFYSWWKCHLSKFSSDKKNVRFIIFLSIFSMWKERNDAFKNFLINYKRFLKRLNLLLKKNADRSKVRAKNIRVIFFFPTCHKKTALETLDIVADAVGYNVKSQPSSYYNWHDGKQKDEKKREDVMHHKERKR